MSKQLLSKLKKQIDKKSFTQVSVELGYRSQQTVRNWFTGTPKIPKIAVEKVKAYLQTNK